MLIIYIRLLELVLDTGDSRRDKQQATHARIVSAGIGVADGKRGWNLSQ